MTDSVKKPLEMVCVVAMARNRVIGDGTGLIWHLPGDLKRVKALTMGCPLIMGRRTWDSIGRPLPGRASIVMTRDADWAADGALRAGNLDMAVTLARGWMGPMQAFQSTRSAARTPRLDLGNVPGNVHLDLGNAPGNAGYMELGRWGCACTRNVRLAHGGDDPPSVLNCCFSF